MAKVMEFHLKSLSSVSLVRCTAFIWIVFSIQCALSTKVYNIHWNSSNPIFRIDKTDNVIDVNAGNYPSEYDQVNIVCPVYKVNMEESHQERYIIYLVSKEEYDSCRITNPNPKIIAVCNRPYTFMYFTITFRSFTPTPGGLEFHPGQDYYFISTSSRNDLHRRVGGGCSTNNMRLIFKVASKDGGEDNSLAQNTDEDQVDTTQVRRKYHPWHLPQKESTTTNFQKHLVREETFETSTTDTFYYPIEEMERAKELIIPSGINHRISNIYRGARKAYAQAQQNNDDFTSGVGRQSHSFSTILFILGLSFCLRNLLE